MSKKRAQKSPKKSKKRAQNCLLFWTLIAIIMTIKVTYITFVNISNKGSNKPSKALSHLAGIVPSKEKVMINA